MKKSILFSFLFAIMVATSCSDNKISEDKVPGAAVSAFKAKYPAATDTKWITEKKGDATLYEAQFKSEGKEVEAEFNEDGSFKQED